VNSFILLGSFFYQVKIANFKEQRIEFFSYFKMFYLISIFINLNIFILTLIYGHDPQSSWTNYVSLKKNSISYKKKCLRKEKKNNGYKLINITNIELY
jgi:uncharacterized membrane protein